MRRHRVGLILFSGLPLPRHLLTHIQAPARVTRPTASQPVQSRCLFSASPRENSLPAGACPILSLPPPPAAPPPALGYSLCRKGPRTQGKAPRSSCPGQDTCFLHQLAPSALPGGRKSDPGLGNMGALHGGQPKVILSLPLPPARGALKCILEA